MGRLCLGSFGPGRDRGPLQGRRTLQSRWESPRPARTVYSCSVAALWGASGDRTEKGRRLEVCRSGVWKEVAPLDQGQGWCRFRWRTDGVQSEVRCGRLLLWLRDGPLADELHCDM